MYDLEALCVHTVLTCSFSAVYHIADQGRNHHLLIKIVCSIFAVGKCPSATAHAIIKTHESIVVGAMAYMFHSKQVRNDGYWCWPNPTQVRLATVYHKRVWCTVFNWRIHISPHLTLTSWQIKVFSMKEACQTICIWMPTAVGKFKETLESLHTELEGGRTFPKPCQHSYEGRK